MRWAVQSAPLVPDNGTLRGGGEGTGSCATASAAASEIPPEMCPLCWEDASTCCFVRAGGCGWGFVQAKGPQGTGALQSSVDPRFFELAASEPVA